MTRLLLLAAVVFVATGCDQNAFEEDYPDIENGLGTYVAFDAVSIQSDFTTSIDPETGLNITVPQSTGFAFGLPVRLPAAVGEDVTVSYTLSGDAEAGTDYTIGGTQGQLVIPYEIDQTGSFSEDLLITTFPAAAGDAAQSVTITLTGATSASGRTYTVGRLPDGRDQKVTLNFVPPTAQ